MRKVSLREMNSKPEYKPVSSLTVENIEMILRMEALGVKRRLIANAYKISYSDLLTILPVRVKSDTNTTE